MAGKVFIVLAVVLTVQLATCVEDLGVSPETKHELMRAIIGTIEAKKQGGGQISVVSREIEKNVDNALHPIEKEMDALKNNVRVAKNKAKAQNVDISDCVQAERDGAHKIDKDHVKDCKHTPAIKKAEGKLRLIGKEIEHLKGLKTTCGTDKDPDQCVLKAIDASYKSTDAHQKEIAAIMKKAKPQEADKCISKNAAQLKSQVDNLNKQWSACLEKHNIKEL